MLIEVLHKIRSNLPIVLIVSLAFILRVSQTSFFPPALNWDEVSHGYNAFSILKTGKDEWGESFPTIFRAYGDYKLPVYIYLAAISEFFLGLTELAVRLPSILAGTVSVLFTYLLVKQLFNHRQSPTTEYRTLALISALLLAIEPWGLFTSRIAVEANVAVFLIIAGVYFFLRGLHSIYYILPATVFLGLSVWTYNSARIFVPMLAVALIVIYWRGLKKVLVSNGKFTACCMLLAAFFFLPMVNQLLNPAGLARYSWVEILDQGSAARILETRSKVNLPDPLPRLISNKVTYFGKTFVANYFSHFSPDFLFLKGGSHYQFSVPGHGLLYGVDGLFFVIGLFVLAKNFKKAKEYRFLTWWIILAPVASSLTREAPHALRSLVMLPAPMITAALGIVWAGKYLAKGKNIPLYIFVGLYLFFLGVSGEKYVKKLVFEYRPSYSWAWQYGYKEVASYLKANYEKYDRIILTKKYGEPHEFILFYGAAAGAPWPWDPTKYNADPSLVRFYQSEWYWVDRFDKFFFVNDWQIPKTGEVFVAESKNKVDCSELRCLFVTSPGNSPIGWHKLETVNFLDGKSAFEILEN